jgi:hypothetical protein
MDRIPYSYKNVLPAFYHRYTIPGKCYTIHTFVLWWHIHIKNKQELPAALLAARQKSLILFLLLNNGETGSYRRRWVRSKDNYGYNAFKRQVKSYSGFFLFF